MKRLLGIAFIFLVQLVDAQPPQLELEPQGFEPVEVSIPSTPNEKLIELSKNWAMEFNRRTDTEGRYDINNVTGNSLTITAYKKRAFYYTNRGEPFDHKIKYDMRLIFDNDRYTVSFVITEVYLKDKLLEYTIPDYFTSEGELKEGYEEIETSLEQTVNYLIESHYNFIMNFR